MTILIVANHNKGHFTPFIIEQVDALKRLGVEIEFFGVHGKGFLGYLSNLPALKKKIRECNPDMIHAHYGLSGLLANLQRKVPVVTTYHGSDIHSKGKNLFLSRIAIRLSAYNIFVSEELQKQAGNTGKNQCVQPCGVDATTFSSMERNEARKLLGWDVNCKYVLFAGAFDNDVKNSPLAKAATALVPEAQLIELNGYSREQVNWAMNAANCLLMTSFREGSPVVVKEAMLCGTPIVSVNVGDVKNIIAGIEGCYITSYEVYDIANSLRLALSFNGKTNGIQRILEQGLSNESIAKHIVEIYKHVLAGH